MKSFLLATTMLASVTGYAAADVALSGDARMGIVSSDNTTTFESRMRIKFTGSGTTDGGLAFGGSFRAQDAQGAEDGTSGTVYMSGAFGKIAFGDVDSADLASTGQLASVGYTGLGSTNEINYAADGFDAWGLPAKIHAVRTLPDFENTSDNRYDLTTDVAGGAASKVLYTYSAGNVTLNASVGQLSNGSANHDSYAAGVDYVMGNLTLAAGYGKNELDFETMGTLSGFETIDSVTLPYSTVVDAYSVSADVTDMTASATYVMGATTLKGIYQDKRLDASVRYTNNGTYVGTTDESLTAQSYGLSVQHTMEALTLTAFGVTTRLKDGILSDSDNTVDLNRYGLGASYDLGGGASFLAGAVRVETPDLNVTGNNVISVGKTSYSAFDVGVNFSF